MDLTSNPEPEMNLSFPSRSPPHLAAPSLGPSEPLAERRIAGQWRTHTFAPACAEESERGTDPGAYGSGAIINDAHCGNQPTVQGEKHMSARESVACHAISPAGLGSYVIEGISDVPRATGAGLIRQTVIPKQGVRSSDVWRSSCTRKLRERVCCSGASHKGTGGFPSRAICGSHSHGLIMRRGDRCLQVPGRRYAVLCGRGMEISRRVFAGWRGGI